MQVRFCQLTHELLNLSGGVEFTVVSSFKSVSSIPAIVQLCTTMCSCAPRSAVVHHNVHRTVSFNAAGALEGKKNEPGAV